MQSRDPIYLKNASPQLKSMVENLIYNLERVETLLLVQLTDEPQVEGTWSRLVWNECQKAQTTAKDLKTTLSQNDEYMLTLSTF